MSGPIRTYTSTSKHLPSIATEQWRLKNWEFSLVSINKLQLKNRKEPKIKKMFLLFQLFNIVFCKFVVFFFCLFLYCFVSLFVCLFVVFLDVIETNIVILFLFFCSRYINVTIFYMESLMKDQEWLKKILLKITVGLS